MLPAFALLICTGRCLPPPAFAFTVTLRFSSAWADQFLTSINFHFDTPILPLTQSIQLRRANCTIHS